MKSYTQIPEGYTLSYDLHLLKNKRVFVLLNVLSFVLIVPLLPGVLFFDFTTLEIPHLMLFIVMMVLSVVIHELIHAFFFHRFSGTKVKFQFHGWAASASTPGIYYRKKYYLIIGLAPAVILNPILLLLALLLPAPYNLVSYLTLMVHFSGCVGDFYVTWIMRKYPEDMYAEDTGIGMRFYEKTNTDIDFD